MGESDHELFKLFWHYHYLTPEQVAGLLNRSLVNVRVRLRRMWLEKYLKRGRDFQNNPNVYFLDGEGVKHCLETGIGKEPRWTHEKSLSQIDHEMTITRFHIALTNAFGDRLTAWEQHRGMLKDRVSVNGENFSIIPDALFVLDKKQAFFLEITKALESKSKRTGLSSVVEKAYFYTHYVSQFKETWTENGEDFRVIFMFPTEARATNMLEKLEPEYPYRRFWLTDEKSAENITAEIFRTPRDFKERSYAFDN